MLAQEHPSNKLSDYVLGLLSPAERQRIDRHLARCARCRQALKQERSMTREVRQTLHAATRPSPEQLTRLLPPASSVQRRRRFEAMLRPALAFSIVLVLFALSMQIDTPGARSSAPAPTATVVAATATNTPTSTTEAHAMRPAPVLLDEQPAWQSPPTGTPVAALFSFAHN